MLIEITKPDFSYKDDRGAMIQLVRDGFKQVNIITTKAGSFRGGHYHRFNHEAFYIISGELRLTVRGNGRKEEKDFSTGDMFLIPPMVSHDFFYVTDTTLVSLYDHGVEMQNGEKDIVKG